MKLACLLVLSLGLASETSNAGLISFWSFDNSTTAANGGSQQGTASFSSTSGSVSYVPGTSVNDVGSRAITPAIQYTPDGGSFTIHLNGTGLSSFDLTYAAKADGSSGYQFWQWSTDGANYQPVNDLGSSVGVGGWGTARIDLSGITELNNAHDVYLMNDFTGAGSLISYDNIQISAVPEPTNLALATFGGLALVAVATRRILRGE